MRNVGTHHTDTCNLQCTTVDSSPSAERSIGPFDCFHVVFSHWELPRSCPLLVDSDLNDLHFRLLTRRSTSKPTRSHAAAAALSTVWQIAVRYLQYTSSGRIIRPGRPAHSVHPSFKTRVKHAAAIHVPGGLGESTSLRRDCVSASLASSQSTVHHNTTHCVSVIGAISFHICLHTATIQWYGLDTRLKVVIGRIYDQTVHDCSAHSAERSELHTVR